MLSPAYGKTSGTVRKRSKTLENIQNPPTRPKHPKTSENFKREKANLGQIFVGLQKGRPEITFKENIVLNSKLVNK